MSEQNSDIAPNYPLNCPSRKMLEMLADKWKLLIIHALAQGERRNGDLIRAIEGVSQKMLTQTLRSLQRDGFVARNDYQEMPPRIGYQLTPLGISLRTEVLRLSEWGCDHFDDILAAQTAYDENI